MKGNNKVLPNDVLAAAAHELKAPLVLMRHLVQTLDEGTLLSATERQQHIERLAFTTDRMLRLTQHLTASYRIDHDDIKFALEPLNVSLLCEQALHEISPYAAAHGQILQFVSKKRGQLVLAQRDMLHDMIINLVDNAIRHNGGGDRVVVDVFGRSNYVRLRVHDNGFGVPPSELRTLKQNIGVRPQPFNARSGTSGLGLYIVGQLAQAMGAQLGVGRARKGATFFVDLMRSRQMSLL